MTKKNPTPPLHSKHKTKLPDLGRFTPSGPLVCRWQVDDSIADRLITSAEATALVQAMETPQHTAAAVRRFGQALTADKPLSLVPRPRLLTNPANDVALNLRINPPDQERALLIRQLVDYNQSKAGPRHFSQFGIFSRRPNQELIGGLLGYISWKWLSIEVFWVAESSRRVGLGGRLLREAEEFALKHNCRFAQVETYSFQARGFYEKHGYRLFGMLENYPPGHECYYFRKTLRPG